MSLTRDKYIQIYNIGTFIKKYKHVKFHLGKHIILLLLRR